MLSCPDSLADIRRVLEGDWSTAPENDCNPLRTACHLCAMKLGLASSLFLSNLDL